MIGISVCVVLDYELSRLVLLAMGDLPSRALREPPATNNDDTGAENLQPERQSPFDIACEVKIGPIDSFTRSEMGQQIGFYLPNVAIMLPI